LTQLRMAQAVPHFLPSRTARRGPAFFPPRTGLLSQRGTPHARSPGPPTRGGAPTRTPSHARPARPLPPLTDAWTPPVSGSFSPFPSSPPRNSAPDIPGELAGIHIPLHPAIPGALPLIGPPRTPPAPYSTR
jgi:hypothetical protein